MGVLGKNHSERAARLRLAAAACPVIETMESRILMSGTVDTEWSFNNLATGTNTTPAASTGTGSASTIGMLMNFTGSGTPADKSAIGSGTGSADTGSPNEAWTVNGNNGWTSTAAIGSQGAQFLASTVNYSGISVQFDWEDSTQGEGKLQVQYTTDGSTWINASTISTNGDANIAALTNSSSSNTVMGSYFKVTSNTGFNNGLTANLSGISAANNDASFGVRLVNASTGADVVNSTGTAAPTVNKGNWTFDEVKIIGTFTAPQAPAVTTQPISQTVNGGTNVTFTAAATGTPTPTVEWWVEASGASSFTDTGVSTASYTFTASPANNGSQYEAVFTNGVNPPATSNPATLTVPTAPLITTQPTSQTVSAGSAATFSAVAFGSPAPSVEWFSEAPGASTFTDTGVSTTTYTFPPTEAQTGTQIEAVFTSTGSTPTTSNIVTLTVLGTPITVWSLPSQATSPVVAPLPAPTVGAGSALPQGMNNDDTGVQSFPEDDITATPGVADPSYTENLWRIRGGSGQGGTGSPGTPEGWSSVAPEFMQAAEFDVSTLGYQNIAVHFDWYSTAQGVRDAQPEYTTDGSTWLPIGPVIVAAAGDYYGSTNSSTPPTGVTLNFQGSAYNAVNNNPNFGVRLAAAYDPALPLINDGNLLITDGMGNPVAHGQYAAATTVAANAEQQLVVGGTGLGGSFTLSLGSLTTGPISYTSAYSVVGGVDTSTLATNIAAALNALTGVSGVTVTTMDLHATNFTVNFTGAQANVLTANAALLTGTNPSVTETYAGTINPYTIAGSGNWRFGNIAFSGDTISGAPGILTQPANQVATLANGSFAAVAPGPFAASAYSESPVTVQWQSSTNGTNWTPVTDSPSAFTFTNVGNVYSATYTVSSPTLGESGTEYRAVFSNVSDSSLTATTNVAVLTVVIPIAPSITTQPLSISVLTGGTATFTAAATGLPASTGSGGSVVWQFSSDDGMHWNNVTISGTTTATTTSTVLASGNDLTTSTLSLVSTAGENGFEYQAIFSNSIGSATTGLSSGASTATVLTVLAIEPAITQWNFSSFPSSGTAAYNNSPTPTLDGAPSLLNSIGFNDDNFETVYGGPPSVTADDVTSTSGTLNTGFTENTWRVRGGQTSTSGGAPANGWDALAPEYSQGIEADINTTGYQSIYVTFDWYQTAQGARDLQEQYSLNINAADPLWININPALVAPAAGDFYGTTTSSVPPTGALIDLTSITGANNNANFGIRLVSAYDPALPVITDSTTIQGENSYTLPEPHGQYASATLINGSPTPLNGSSGNWRFGPISINGIVIPPAWLGVGSQATWNPTNSTLTVTGPTTIISDPGTAEPIISATGSAAQVTIPSTVTGSQIHLGGIELSGGAGIDDQMSHDVLVVGTAAGGAPLLSIDASSKLNLESNDLIVHNGSLSGVNTMVMTGANGGRWNGDEIFSSAAANSGNTELGVEMNTTGATTIDGETVSSADVLVFYTFDGGADFSTRAVIAHDYFIIDNAFNNNLTVFPDGNFADGDFNYDGVINGDDYTLIDNAYNSQSSMPLAIALPTVATNTAQIASTVKASGTAQAVFAQTATITFDDSDLKKRRENVWADLEN